ncbi:thioredoxin domain-containing protein [Flexibacterium corallicola]|uniref:thioredoxin domain-containing protein n=1 Tax=Flexibacterium corallicola TaxID=3037259 RepID=UPI00286F2946|nr:thioredoxin domain-containing protein [Pseudovibrio sp. M1P-2-3]
MSYNRLTDASSPYLLQHKDNPVHWWEWGEEALLAARQSNRPILLSVGYSACHWCHVMAHESFEDPQTANLMNQLYINIKVDREERPDIDHIYMRALNILGEQGGWPLTMFLTPDAEPFWGGTYFPPTQQYGRPSFKDVLVSISDAFNDNKEGVTNNREAIVTRLKHNKTSSSGELDPALISQAGKTLSARQDPLYGGTIGAPKFPQAAVQELIYRSSLRDEDDHLLYQFIKSVDALCLGGIYDHVGGGLARYSTDEKWEVPHFEKMLYDNAFFIQHLTWAFAATQNTFYLEKIKDCVSWLEREMLLPDGGFASALDADSDGEEGKYYLWTCEELRQVLPDEHWEFFTQIYGIDLSAPSQESLTLKQASFPEEEQRLGVCHRLLREHRERTRTPPAKDNKVLVDWNGYMIIALVSASEVTEHTRFRELAEQCYRFIKNTIAQSDLRLSHSWREGTGSKCDFAVDYAAMARAALALGRTEKNQLAKSNFYKDASGFLDRLTAEFQSETGGFYLSSHNADNLIVRPLHCLDEAVPNYNSSAALAFTEHWILTGDDHSKSIADKIFQSFSKQIVKNVYGTAAMLNALDTRSRFIRALMPKENSALKKEILSKADPVILLDIGNTTYLPMDEELQEKEALYLCSERGCSQPITRLQDLHFKI